MKILYISKSILPSRTANSINVMKMCQAFAENGNEVVLVAPDIKDEYEKNVEDIYQYYGVKKNFKIKKLWHPNLKFGAFLYTLSIFFYLCINKRFNLVYGRFLHGCYVATVLKNKVIFESHVPIFYEKSHRLIIFKKLIKNKYFKKMVVISQSLKNIYLENGYLSDAKIQIAHDGADEVKNFDSKIKLFGKKNNFKVGYVGHLYKGKGMEIITAMDNKLDHDIEIHIIGGLKNDIQYWKNKISNKNIFFYGFVPHQKISDYINALDVCLLPNQKIVFAHGSDSSKDNINISTFTSPLKLFEYMSHKKPIIASDLPVIREVLNEKNSILVKYNDIKLWISSIQNLKNIKKRESIANQALSDFYTYSWKNRALLVINN
jgi:glycosyltransferase involved in cell wall biosynthesis